MKAYLDTAVLVAASVADHPHHSQSLATLQMVRKKAMTGHISGHGLSETYAVLTRTPFTPPIYPAEAWKLLSYECTPLFSNRDSDTRHVSGDDTRMCGQRLDRRTNL